MDPVWTQTTGPLQLIRVGNGRVKDRLEEMVRRRYVPPFYFASIHYALGDLPQTFRWGWKAVGDRCDYLMYLRVEPQVGRLAGNPEFVRVLGQLHP